VLDTAGVASYSVYPLYGPYRLVIDCVRTPIAAVIPAPRVSADVRREPTSAPLTARRLTTDWLRQLPAMPSHATTLLANARVAAAPAAPLSRQGSDTATPTSAAAPIADLAPIAPLTPVPPPARNLNGGFSIARQLGLGVARIVIDAGHGGHDPGAKGKGVTEAELVLDVALRLEKLLQKVAGVEVILTRRTDDFIPLQERTAIANREGADLFLSIHANASPNAAARGIETYFLNFANNLSAAAVAARENAASGQVMGALPDFVKAIALNNKLDESRDFATQVQRSMIERLKTTNKTVKDLGVKQAPFVVLIGAAMPSVLAEISFVTNPQEARLLKGNVYRQRIAESLLNAIRKYQTSLKAAATVAHQ
jgi:N-acetylmuramoyl-L-alanine amidase